MSGLFTVHFYFRLYLYYEDFRFLSFSNGCLVVFDLLRTLSKREYQESSLAWTFVILEPKDRRPYTLLFKDNKFGGLYTMKQYRWDPLTMYSVYRVEVRGRTQVM